jgi:hypothetical protein
MQIPHTRSLLARKQSTGEVVENIMEMKEKEQMLTMITLWQRLLERNRVREGEKMRGHQAWQGSMQTCLMSFWQ